MEGFTFSILASTSSHTGFFVKVLKSFLIKLPSKGACIKEPLQSVELVKPSISRVWIVLHFLYLLLQALIKASYKGALTKCRSCETIHFQGLDGFTFSTLASTSSYKGFFVKVL